ncbi:MAG: hypothetical protein D4R67_12010 [Bacteroidetes bacterium]|nr:MAG: hypothetical protein D4R67_12010 [Bacteroidota bacterium]
MTDLNGKWKNAHHGSMIKLTEVPGNPECFIIEYDSYTHEKIHLSLGHDETYHITGADGTSTFLEGAILKAIDEDHILIRRIVFSRMKDQ